MSMATVSPVGTTTKSLPPGHYGISGLLRSEWTKLRTVRSTMWTLGVTVVVGIGISALATAETRAHWATMSPGNRLSFDPTSTSLTALLFCQLAIGVLGVLVMSAEYGTGTIRATFSAAPRRPLVLAAKAAVFGLVALVVAEVVAFASFLVGQALLSAPATHATLSTPGALRAVVGTGLYLGVIGLFALGLATIIRHTAGAISAFVGILLVLPIIVRPFRRDESACGGLDVRAGDGEVDDEDEDGRAEDDRRGPVSEVDPADVTGLADVVGEGRPEGPRDDVGRPEGGNAVQAEPPPRQGREKMTTPKRMPEAR
jgi:ABC-2 type transport system permease protein